jgi:ABC-type polysaccharide/polyol phosphate transport system ATPase subunit
MSAIVKFESVSKHYRLQHEQNRPRSFRDIFIGRWQPTWPPARKPDRLWALRDVSLEISRGETVGLIGPNGAGKSTVLKLISTVIVPNSGRVVVGGKVAALLELGTGFHPDLSGRDNVFLAGALAGMSRSEVKRKFDSIVAFSELEGVLDMPVKHYSSGMFARLAFAVSIHLDPEILLVDEVLAVGDQNFQQKCLDRIGELRRQGITICLVSHSLDTVRSLCTRAVWVDHGHIEADGAAEAVVLQYLDRMLALESGRLSESSILSPERRWGSRKVEIVDVRLTNASGQEQTVFETGQHLTVWMHYCAREAVPSPIFGIAIHRQDGVHICGPNTRFAGLTLPTLAGEGLVSFSVPALPLLEGLYQITVAVVNDNDTEIFDYHDRVYHFRVVNTSGRVRERFGLMSMNSEWQCLPGSRLSPQTLSASAPAG